MVFLRLTSFEDEPPPILAGALALRLPRASDYEAWARLRAESRKELEPFEPQWSADDLSRHAFRARLRAYQQNRRQATGYAFFIERIDDGQLVGGLNLSHVRRGIVQAASVGYWIGTPFTRRGYMRQALTALLPFAFEELRLHRLEAACMPENIASRKVLEAVGFFREGLARRYLRINGLWHDHILYALTEEDWRR